MKEKQKKEEKNWLKQSIKMSVDQWKAALKQSEDQSAGLNWID